MFIRYFKKKVILIYRLFNKNLEIRMTPENAYDIIAKKKVLEKFNLMHFLDQDLLNRLMHLVKLTPVNSVDFGAGIGRNIPTLMDITSDNIFACDLSSEMIKIINDKFPEVATIKINTDNKITIEKDSVDLIISNLTIGYIIEVFDVFLEWDRILKSNAFIIITDLHPNVISSGGKRIFKVDKRKINIKNRAHSKKVLVSCFEKLDWEIISYSEICIDDSHIEHFVDRIDLFNKLRGNKMLHGFLLQKK